MCDGVSHCKVVQGADEVPSYPSFLSFLSYLTFNPTLSKTFELVIQYTSIYVPFYISRINIVL